MLKKQLKEMVLALLNESDLTLSDDIVGRIVDKVSNHSAFHLDFSAFLVLFLTLCRMSQTFIEVDSKGDGRIDEEEWKEYAAKNPSLLKNMTLPYLMYVLTIQHLNIPS